MRELLLSNGMFAKVDDEDYPSLVEFRWHHRKGRQSSYAQTHIYVLGKRTTLRMHQFLIQAPPGMEIDHINGDGLDNQRGNLRLASKSQNQANRSKRGLSSASRFKGVSWTSNPGRRSKPWRASLVVRGKTKNLGNFATEEEAAEAYNAAATVAFGPFALLNHITHEEVQLTRSW